MKKVFINYFVTVAVFIGFFIIYTWLLYNVASESAMMLLATIYFFSIPVVGLFSFITSAHYAKINAKKISDYIKRVWEQIFVLVLLGFAVSVIGSLAVPVFFGGLAIKINHPFFSGFIIKFPMLIAYLAFAYRFFRNYGYKHASKQKYNISFQIISIFYAYMCIIPHMIHDGMYGYVNPHTAFTPNINLYDDFLLNVNASFNLSGFITILTATLTVEIFILTFAYKKGRQTYVKKLINKDVETDEINQGITLHDLKINAPTAKYKGYSNLRK